MEPPHPIESQAAPSDRVTRHAHDKACRHHPIESQAPTNRSMSYHCSVSGSEKHAGGGCLGDDAEEWSDSQDKESSSHSSGDQYPHVIDQYPHATPHTQITMFNHMVT